MSVTLSFMDLARSGKAFDYDAHIQILVKDGDAFRERFLKTCPAEENLNISNAWIQSPDGAQTLQNLTQDTMDFLAAYPAGGVPAHDRRHVFKDLASSFHIINEAGFANDWRGLLVFPSLLHDSGRLIEEDITGGSDFTEKAGTHHAYLSYEKFQHMLKKYPQIPQALQDEMLFAVLVHQTGKDHGRTMAAAVQRADREQLLGGEGLVRILQRDVPVFNIPLRTPDYATGAPQTVAEQGAGYLPLMVRYAWRLYPNMGLHGEDRASFGKAEILSFVQCASLGNGASVDNIHDLDSWDKDPFIAWTNAAFTGRSGEQGVTGENIAQQARQIRNHVYDLLKIEFPGAEAVSNLVLEQAEMPISKLTDDIKDRLRQKVAELTPQGQNSLGRAMLLMQQFRAANDKDDILILRKINRHNDQPAYLKMLAGLCLENMGRVPPVPSLTPYL